MDSGTIKLIDGVRRRERGFTLVEVMVALGILAFGILAIASMQTASLGGISFAGNTTDATTVAMNQMDALIPIAWNSPQLAIGGPYNLPDVGRFKVRYDVTAGPMTNTRNIRVRVEWNEKGAPKTTSLTYTKMDVI
jgi:prepilin-type N-terminal cleavage/methylation domain-containing protein